MVDVGRVGEYDIGYLDARQNSAWPAELPQQNWILLAIVGETDKVLFDHVTRACMQHPPLGVCCAGPSAHLLEDWFDEEIVLAEIAWQDQQQAQREGTIVTTADLDIDEGFWYAATVAPGVAAEAVKTIFCLDLTGTYQARIRQLIELINSGWLPPNSENA